MDEERLLGEIALALNEPGPDGEPPRVRAELDHLGGGRVLVKELDGAGRYFAVTVEEL